MTHNESFVGLLKDSSCPFYEMGETRTGIFPWGNMSHLVFYRDEKQPLPHVNPGKKDSSTVTFQPCLVQILLSELLDVMCGFADVPWFI
jgi:hypothetical protein